MDTGYRLCKKNQRCNLNGCINLRLVAALAPLLIIKRHGSWRSSASASTGDPQTSGETGNSFLFQRVKLFQLSSRCKLGRCLYSNCRIIWRKKFGKIGKNPEKHWNMSGTRLLIFRISRWVFKIITEFLTNLFRIYFKIVLELNQNKF